MKGIALWTLLTVGWVISTLAITSEFGEEIGFLFIGVSLMVLAIWKLR